MRRPLLTIAELRAHMVEIGESRAADLIPHPLEQGQLPQQTFYVGKRIRVRFPGCVIDQFGVIVRDDLVAPEMMVIRLDDGRHVLQVECEETEPWGEPL